MNKIIKNIFYYKSEETEIGRQKENNFILI